MSGLLRSYRNSRTWGTGRQGRVLDEGRRSRMFRMGRQSGGAGGQTNLLTLPGCEGCEGGDARSGERKVREEQGVIWRCLAGAVCGTDGKTYESLCHLKETACRLVRRQGEETRGRQEIPVSLGERERR